MRRGLPCHNHGCGRPHEEESISAHLWIVRGRVREVSRVALRDAVYVVQGEGRAAADPRLLAWQCTRGCLGVAGHRVCSLSVHSHCRIVADRVRWLCPVAQTCSAGRHCNARCTCAHCSGRDALFSCHAASWRRPSRVLVVAMPLCRALLWMPLLGKHSCMLFRATDAAHRSTSERICDAHSVQCRLRVAAHM